jgi:hypothetical protein
MNTKFVSKASYGESRLSGFDNSCGVFAEFAAAAESAILIAADDSPTGKPLLVMAGA